MLKNLSKKTAEKTCLINYEYLKIYIKIKMTNSEINKKITWAHFLLKLLLVTIRCHNTQHFLKKKRI